MYFDLFTSDSKRYDQIMFKYIFSLLILMPLWGHSQEIIYEDTRHNLQEGPRLKVTSIVDGDTLFLEDNQQIRLVGIQAPKLPLGRPGFKKWPLADESRNLLTRLSQNQYVTLYYGGNRRDRYNRTLAHLYLDDGTWIQGELLKAGLARVYSFADNRAIVPQMLAAETHARQNNRGMWRLDHYKIRTTENAVQHLNNFELVEGTIYKVAKVKGTIYLNFAKDWKSDFTLTLKNKAIKMFQKAGIDPLELAGKKIRARGWLKYYNGPAITITHPEQIEILEP